MTPPQGTPALGSTVAPRRRPVASLVWMVMGSAACSDGGGTPIPSEPDPGGRAGPIGDVSTQDVATPDVAGGALPDGRDGPVCPPGEGFELGQVVDDLAFPSCDGDGTVNLRDLCGSRVGWIRGYYGW